jgi:hypothetical protein
MGNSTLTLETILDEQAGAGQYDPRSGPSGFNLNLILRLANDTMADLIAGAEDNRFNWKWNRALAAPFLTNSFQQDYPQPTQAAGLIGWGDDCDKIDINNTMIPKPINVPAPPKWKRNLSRVTAQYSGAIGGPAAICWMYNNELSYGTWPGAHTVYSPLITTGAGPQNPLMSMIDANGNYLILTGFGTTGTTAPAAAVNAVEGMAVPDGSCTWTVVSGTSQGFRVWPLPNAAGPCYQLIPSYQLEPPLFTSLGQTINPIPNSFARHFRRAFSYQCKGASRDPVDRKEFLQEYPMWLNGLRSIARQADKEPNAYRLLAATSPVDEVWPGNYRYTADQPV